MAKREKLSYISEFTAVKDSTDAMRYEVKPYELGFYIHILKLVKGAWKLQDVTTRNTPVKSDRYLMAHMLKLKANGYVIRDRDEKTIYRTIQGFYESGII